MLCFEGMATKNNPRKDLNELAFSILQQATGEVEKPPAKVDGRAAGGLARAKKQTKEERIDLARLAATARWKKAN
jgi:hypothetical protein